jgi:hypothetical protein
MRLLSPALLALGLLLAPTVLAAPRIPAVAAPPLVRVGERYETALPDLPEGADECELFLLPEDGSGRMIQLTPEREVEDGPLRWRMPRVHATRARLVLRAGGRFGETESPPSAAFAIVTPRPPGRAEVLRGRGELAWHFGDPAAARPAALRAPAGAAFGLARPSPSAAPPPHGPAAELPARARPADGAVAVASDPDPSAPHPSRRPAFVPLRN